VIDRGVVGGTVVWPSAWRRAKANYRFAYARDAIGWVARLVLSILTVLVMDEVLGR
jgi:hypothetical protein